MTMDVTNGSQRSKGDILIVDDNQDALQLLSQIFDDSGYRVRMASNGMEALWSAVLYQPDLILLDVRMPGMNGLDVCQCLKHHPATASIPVVIVSAADSPQDRIAGFEAGAVDFIGKPFVDTEVLARADTHLQMTQVRRDILRRRKLNAMPACEPLANPQQVLEEIFSFSTCAILFIGPQGNVDYVNPAFVRLSGHALDDPDGIDPHRLFVDTDFLSNPYAPIGSLGCSGLLRLRRNDGVPVLCEVHKTTFVDPLGKAAHVVALSPAGRIAADPVVTDSPSFHEFATFALIHSPYPGLENTIHNALERQEFTLFYQPVYDLTSKYLIGAEALLRWQHPRHGLLLPYQFMMTAEETGASLPIGRWVADAACRQLMAWCGTPLPADFTMSINIGSLQFWQDGLIDELAAAIGKHGLPANCLQIEITTETLLEDLAQGMLILHRLKDRGVTLALDRYGHGALSSDVLARLPIDILKLDPKPIVSMNEDIRSQQAVRNLIELGHELRMRVVANGIEQKWHLALMESCRCDFGQGYLLGRPLSATQFLAAYLHD